MKATDLIKDMRAQLAGMKAAGYANVTVQSMEGYLAAAEPVAVAAEDAKVSAQAEARAQRDFEMWKEQAPLAHAAAVEMFKSALEAGQTGLRFLLAINGGAAVALLAFLGNVLSKDLTKGMNVSIASINQAMGIFVLGVGLAASSAVFRYFTQFAAASRWPKGVGICSTWMAILLGVGSLAAFFEGGWLAYRAFA